MFRIKSNLLSSTYKKLIIPIIYYKKKEDVLRNVDFCIKANVDGIILATTKHISDEDFLDLGKEIKSCYNNLWIGYNFIDKKPLEVFDFLTQYNIKIDGIIIENSMNGVYEYKEQAIELYEEYNYYKQKVKKDIVYIGGVGLKKFKIPENFFSAIHNYSMNKLDVVMIDNTNIEEVKIASVATQKSYINKEDKIPLAILDTPFIDKNNRKNNILKTNMITLLNIKDLLEFVDILIVSNIVSVSNEILDFEKLLKITNIAHNYKKKPKKKSAKAENWNNKCLYCEQENDFMVFEFNEETKTQKYKCNHCQNEFSITEIKTD
jgi:hypothetical protein